ncbi:hypothetical protein HSX11_25780 [Oxalobacteraceae bacterium]|nr:hypothetical protein [Oxalobacteraceae bacterium]
MNLSIKEFWTQRFANVAKQASLAVLPGWNGGCEADEFYVPAKLTLREGFDDLSQNVWLIGAPGAVGKSTLAKEICAATGAVYVDLATAATVAGNYMVGGLVYTQLLAAWTSGTATVLIDALDEARLRVTQSGFEAFLSDVAQVAKMGGFPVIILGRVGIIEEAWTILNEYSNIEPPIFDIELFEANEAKQFVMVQLSRLAKKQTIEGKFDYPDLARALETHRSKYEEATEKVISGIQALSVQDENKFVGYAPVLDAIAKVIASESNPARISEEMQRVLAGRVLLSLSTEILRREAGKLVTQVGNSVPDLPQMLYEPTEQLERLACRIFKLPVPPVPTQLAQHQVAPYEQAIRNLLPQHPFLDGAGNGPSSAVFAACIVATALRGSRPDLVSAAERYVSLTHHTPNPFLYDFYQGESEGATVMPTEHIGLVFESVLAKSKPGDAVRLSIDSGSQEELLNVEIMITRPDGISNRLEFVAPSNGTVRLGRRVAGVSIDAEQTAVELGIGDQLELVAPVSINAGRLKLTCSQLVVKTEPHTADDAVILEAAELFADAAIAAPSVRPEVRLQVSWPGSMAHPWTAFAASAAQEEDVETVDALRALRRLTMAFRSHSKGQLARFKDKIEHARMLKGPVDRALLDKLRDDKIISLSGAMYYLDPDLLGAKVGVSFLDVQLKNYSPQARAYVQGLLP